MNNVCFYALFVFVWVRMEEPESIGSYALFDFIEVRPINFVDGMTHYNNVCYARQWTEEGCIVADDARCVFAQLIHPTDNLVLRILLKI